MQAALNENADPEMRHGKKRSNTGAEHDEVG